MRDVQREAAYHREALRLGVIDVAAVVAWSDSMVARNDGPLDAFLELSCMGKAHPLDVAHVLEEMSRSVSAIEVLPRVLGQAYDRLRLEPDYGPHLARALYQLFVSVGYHVPENLRAIGSFDDAYDLARSGVHGSVQEVHEELLKFARSFANQEL